MHGIRTIVATVLAVGGAAVVIDTTTAQQRPLMGLARELISDAALPGIDRGLRDTTTPTTEIAARALRDQVAREVQSYLPDSFIVKFRPGTSPAALRAMLALVDGASTTRALNADFDIVTTEPGVDPEEAARRLAAQPDVEYAQPRYVIRPQLEIGRAHV